MSARSRTVYVCSACGDSTPKWQGQCPACAAWNTLSAMSAPRQTGRAVPPREAGLAPAGVVQTLGSAATAEAARLPTGSGEFDRVLGGGLVAGSVILIGGDPGIGKSTLLLQAAAALSPVVPVLYATGEESLKQVGLRARRLGLSSTTLGLIAETDVEQILAAAVGQGARVLVVDSIQTMGTAAVESSPGSVSQLRECAARFVQHAKQTGTAVVLIGHVTKEGVIAGPRVLEHLVDTVLYFESDAGSRYRIVRAVKNRFGAANEIGVFSMEEQGLREVKNPSAIFLSRHPTPVAGSLVTVTREGTRPLLIEVQALVDESRSQQPRRITVGLEANRLSLLLAVLHRHAGVALYGHDVFVNVVGGVHLSETAADLPAVLAAVSSLDDRPLASDLVAFGELGLAGEVRPVPFGEERLREAAKHGFKRAIVPRTNVPRRAIDGLEVVGVERLDEALAAIR
ncbi:MAG: DNA repair protein RadA [Proteobacteria bacterium]|nr:DNA repair protein RadA [Pseudomonadota bacterium]